MRSFRFGGRRSPVSPPPPPGGALSIRLPPLQSPPLPTSSNGPTAAVAASIGADAGDVGDSAAAPIAASGHERTFQPKRDRDADLEVLNVRNWLSKMMQCMFVKLLWQLQHLQWISTDVTLRQQQRSESWIWNEIEVLSNYCRHVGNNFNDFWQSFSSPLDQCYSRPRLISGVQRVFLHHQSRVFAYLQAVCDSVCFWDLYRRLRKGRLNQKHDHYVGFEISGVRFACICSPSNYEKYFAEQRDISLASSGKSHRGLGFQPKMVDIEFLCVRMEHTKWTL